MDSKCHKNIKIKEVSLESIMLGKQKYFMLKRFVDIIISLFGLIFLLPLFFLLALLIQLESPKGSPFFGQMRVGKGGRKFRMFKFRSMHLDAEKRLDELLPLNEVEGAMFKLKNDPRVTKLGGFMRKLSLDELPQLLNVLLGDMSLVGPRPPLPREVEMYTEYDKQRFLVKSGCTGLWQVSGRNNLSFAEMVELDLEYIRTISLKQDIKIFFQTFRVIIEADAH